MLDLIDVLDWEIDMQIMKLTILIFLIIYNCILIDLGSDIQGILIDIILYLDREHY